MGLIVVEGLASKCVKLSAGRGEQGSAWQWLQENRVGGGEVAGDNPVEAAWHLLERVVGEEEKGSTALHRAAELIRVFHSLGHIEVAGEVAIELVKAVMGVGSEYFGLEGGLVATGRPAWLPWTVLDRLLLELGDHMALPGVARVKTSLE